jgi:pSer/pThr/pTyr-binding forkhead associated (FHA) protein
MNSHPEITKMAFGLLKQPKPETKFINCNNCREIINAKDAVTYYRQTKRNGKVIKKKTHICKSCNSRLMKA